MKITHIEVYEWKAGSSRPGAERNPSRNCIEILALPSEGQIPQQGDVILLNAENPDGAPTPYRVLGRELMWLRSGATDSQTPAEWRKMWIHVRRLSESEYAREEE